MPLIYNRSVWNYIRIVLVFAVGLLSSNVSFGSNADFAVREIPLLNKFPSRCVIAIYEDSQGEMWYGTEEGLCRDNGYNIKVYRPSDSGVSGITESRVNCVCERSPEVIWFGTPQGVFSVSKITRKVSEVDPEHLSGKEIMSFTEAPTEKCGLPQPQLF